MEFFYHPWYMAAGGALVSSPILIHLINRMRFKRVRWAAMEFLLKSQKRNRRKLIIEQMILLLLRILLVLLAAFLVARFVYGAGGSRGASHVVVVDDTLSMFDRDFEASKEATAYDAAIEQVKELAKHASEASSAQYLRVYLLSEIDAAPLYEARLSDQSVQEIDARFATRLRKPSLLHRRPLVALQKGRKLLEDPKGNEGQRVLHFVSDFRDRDWTADADRLTEVVRGTLEAGINVNFVDVAAPTRNPKVKAVNHHNNVALVDLKADQRVAVEDSDVEFTASIMNFGQAKESRFVEVYVNGEKDLSRDVMLEDLEPGKVKEYKFTLRFQRRARPGMDITEKDSPEDRERKRRLEREQFRVRVTVTKKGKDDDSVAADNVRDTIVELRRKVPILVVDGNKPEYRGVEGGTDMHLLRSLYEATKVYEAEERRLADLAKADLDLYPGIVLLNVGEVPEPVVKKLKQYVEGGGSLTYFLGDEVKPDHYNTALFKAGVFPLLIGPRPFDPLAAGETLELEKRKQKRIELRQLNRQPKVLFPNPQNVVVQRIAGALPFFYALSVNVYWQAQPRSKYDPDLRQTEAPIVLPNRASASAFRDRAMELARQALSATEKLAGKESEFKRYVGPMKRHVDAIRDAIASTELHKLGAALEALLKDPGVDKDPDRPSMADLWKQPDLKNLGAEIAEFRERVLYGDPLLVTRQVGKGRVAAFLTTAGTIPRRGIDEDAVAWNNWGEGEQLITWTYVQLLRGLHQYMVSEGVSAARTLGDDLTFVIDAGRYAPSYTLTYHPQPDLGSPHAGEKQPRPEVEKGVLEKDGGRLSFALRDVRRPGIWTVGLTTLGDGAEADRQETRSVAFNVDAVDEGDLKRVSTNRIVPDLPPGDGKHGKIALRVPGSGWEEFNERQPDASESSLLYLFFILILVVEQAMAVHLSFHSRSGEQAPGTASGAASAPARPTAA